MKQDGDKLKSNYQGRTSDEEDETSDQSTLQHLGCTYCEVLGFWEFY